jgi:hypothetical protein
MNNHRINQLAALAVASVEAEEAKPRPKPSYLNRSNSAATGTSGRFDRYEETSPASVWRKLSDWWSGRTS